MSRFEAWTTHAATLLVGGTGLVYAWMRYLVHPADPLAFAVINHPLQPFVQHLHILVAPSLVFAAGVMWRQHAWPYWRRGVERHRRSGASLLLTLVPMVVSGYLIQTAVDGGWRQVWVIVHLAASGLWLLGYMAHQAPALRSYLRLTSDQR
ncbi:MAG TPA: hypothetical protein VGQ28_15155 [Thermoanaerobaculia bacterium]|nr:hypothetical protein [Thermoanaerobaculia bacterium]